MKRMLRSLACASMATEYYEKIGNVIYGSERLGFAMNSMIDWFLEQNGDAEQASSANKDASSIVAMFFQKNSTLIKFRSEYVRVSDAVSLLQKTASQMAGRESSAVDSLVSETRKLHIAAAQIMEDLGIPGTLPASLREMASKF